ARQLLSRWPPHKDGQAAVSVDLSAMGLVREERLEALVASHCPDDRGENCQKPAQRATSGLIGEAAKPPESVWQFLEATRTIRPLELPSQSDGADGMPHAHRIPFASAARSLRWPLLVALLVTGCTTLRLGQPSVDKSDKDQVPVAPGKRSLRVSQFVFMSDFELKSDLPLFKDLERLRDQVFKELELPTANTVVYVYLFQDRDRYDRFMKAKYPDLPERRAFFVAQPRSVGAADDLMVYTYWGERIQQDLRHELTHALLHSVLKDVPLW